MRGIVVSLVSMFITTSALADAPPASGNDVEDPGAWLSARGVTAFDEESRSWCCCAEVAVGPSSEPALRCSEADDAGVDDSYTIAVRDVVRVVRKGKAVTVLEVWTKLENLDRPIGSLPMLELRLTLARDGRSATLLEGDGREGCPRTSRSSSRSRSKSVDPTRAYDGWIRRICAKRGTYRWRAGRFVRASR